MSHTKKLHAIDVKNKVKRIKKLPEYERERQINALYDRIIAEIDAYYVQRDSMRQSEKKSEYQRLYGCIMAEKWTWTDELWLYLAGKEKERHECEANKKLFRKDVKKEVKRIKKLLHQNRDAKYKALHKRVSDEIELTCARIDNDQHSMGKKRKEARRLLYCVTAFPKDYRKSIYKIWDKAFSEVFGIALKPAYVKKEVKRIKKLPKQEYQAEMLKLMQEIEKYIDDKKTMNSAGGCSNIMRSIEAMPKVYKKVLKAKYWSIFYTNMAHVSGLPLPERAQVQVAWEGHVLMIISGAKLFTLPIDRIINMGATSDSYGFRVGVIGGIKMYLTIEYKKEGKTKHIVVYSTAFRATANIIKYFWGVKNLKGIEFVKQEL